MDGAGGAISATKACFPDAALHRDLEHIKKDVKRTGSMKKVDSELTMEITEIMSVQRQKSHIHFSSMSSGTHYEGCATQKIGIRIAQCVCGVVKVD